MAAQIDLDNVTFSYGDRSVFSRLSLQVQKGEVLCILGANGCGKTTMLRCIGGSLKLKEGKILLDGNDIRSMNTRELARKIGIVFQEHVAPFPFSVLEVVRMGRSPYLGFFESPSRHDTEIAKESLRSVGILHLRDMPYTRISGGERQLVLIARTLAQQPGVVLLDEPTSHLDFRNQALVLRMVGRLSGQGLTVIMTTHLPNHAFLCSSKVALMSKGGFLAVGSPEHVMTATNLRTTYGIDLRIVSVEDHSAGRPVKLCVPEMSDR